MTSTNDGKDVKSNQTSGPKGKTYYIELYKSLDARLSGDCGLQERTRHVCDAWRRIHSLCQHSAPSTHPHLLSWLQRHTARTVLQTEWHKSENKDGLHKLLEEAINDFISESRSATSSRDGFSPPWESQLVQRGEWFQRILANPWGHPTLRVLLDSEAEPPSDSEVLEWLKDERCVMFVTRLRQLAADKRCVDLALLLVSAVMDRVRASDKITPDTDDAKDKSNPENARPTFANVLKADAGFTVDVWELLTDIEFVLLHKRDKRSRCIELAKQTPLRDGYQLVERLQSRLETSPREKKLWKDAKDVATLIAQVIITRCMVVPQCSGASRTALYCCARSLVRLLPAARLPPAAAALAAPAATARHLHTLAAAVDAQSTADMKPFVCELYVRAITAGMNELERLKLKTEKSAEARLAEQTLAAWLTQLAALLAASTRVRCECALTAFSLHPSAAMYERIQAAPPLPPVDFQEPRQELATSEFGSWASDSRSQTNFVKTSETLNLKQTQHQANVLSTAILTEGEALGLSPDLCQDITVLLSGPRLKTLSWDMDREVLLEKCRTYMERTHGGTRTLTTELKYLNLDPKDFDHLPEEEDDDTDIYYGIEKGYEHLVEQYQEPEEIWQDAEDLERTTSANSSDMESIVTPRVRRKKKSKKNLIDSDGDLDPLSAVAEAKRTEKKKERPHSKERSKERAPAKAKTKIPKDPLAADPLSITTAEVKIEGSKEKKKRERKKKDKKIKSEPKSTSLSSLIGMKISQIEVNTEDKVNPLSITDSDYDSQGKSSIHSLNSEGNDPCVLFDGLFSMDELKSPDRNSDKLGLMKNNELHLSDGSITLNSPMMKIDNTDIRNLMNETSKAMHYSLPTPKSDLNQQSPADVGTKEKLRTVTEEVKNSITKLIHFRRQKAMNEQRSPGMSPPITNSPTNTYNKDPKVGMMANAITKPQIPLHTQISPKPVEVPDIPKVYINKRQSEQLAELKDEVKYLLNNQNCIQRPVIQYAQKSNTNMTTSSSKVLSPSTLDKPQEGYIIKNKLQPKPLSRVNEIKSRQTQGASNVNRETPSQKSFHDFLHELQKSINAGAGLDQTTLGNKNIKKEIRPLSRVTPILPTTIKSEPRTFPQCAKQSVQQKKMENALNTFSRLSYMHKNNKSDLKKQIEAVIEHQDQVIKTQQKLLDIDQTINEQKHAKFKYLHTNDLTISRVNKSYSKSTESSQMTKNVVKSEAVPTTSLVDEHPVISNMLQRKETNALKIHIKHENQTKIIPIKNETEKKIVQVENLRDSTTPAPNRFSALSEKDQNDLLLLLRQQRKQNATLPRFDNSGNYNIQALQQYSQCSSTNGTQTHTYNTLPCHQPMSKIVDAPSTSVQVSNTKQLQNNTIKMSNIIQNIVDEKLVQQNQSNISNTELYCTKNANPTPNKSQKTEVISENVAKIAKHIAASKPTEWESVMNALLSHKTPSRGPNALEMALYKDTIDKDYAENILRTHRIMTPIFTEDPMESSVVNDQTIPTSIPNANAATSTDKSKIIRKYTKSSSKDTNKSISKDTNKSISKDTKIKIVCPKPQPQTDITKHTDKPSEVLHGSPNIKKSEPSGPSKRQHQSDNKKPSHTDYTKRSTSSHSKKQFTCAMPKEDDPFISGIPNSDYDLLEELMDDDLRQEIGELSDDDSYSPPEHIHKDPQNFAINKDSAMQRDKRIVTSPVIVNRQQIIIKPVQTQKLDNPVRGNDTPVHAPQTSSFVNTQIKLNTADYRKQENVQENNTVQKCPPNVIVAPNRNVSSNMNRQVNQAEHAFGAANPQQTSLKNVVVLGSDIVYQPCTIHTQVPITNLSSNSYVNFNIQPNMTLYQTTQFSAPVVNPVIIGQAMTMPMSVPIDNIQSTTVPKASEVIIDINKQDQANKIIQTIEKLTETKSVVSNQVINDIAEHKSSQSDAQVTKSEKEIFDYKSCERKVLSEVQETLSVNEKTDKIMTKGKKLLHDHDVKKEISIDQERLVKKRMAILTRNICHRSDDKPIPLTYVPLTPREKDQVGHINPTTAGDRQSDNNLSLKTDLLTNSVAQNSVHQPNQDTKMVCDSPVDSPENCKENKSDTLKCRRILLRSSNRISNDKTFHDSSCDTLTTKTEKLKPNTTESIEELHVKCNDTNHDIPDQKIDLYKNKHKKKKTLISKAKRKNTNARVNHKPDEAKKNLRAKNLKISSSISKTSISTVTEPSLSQLPEQLDIEEQLMGSKIPKSVTPLKFLDESRKRDMNQTVLENESKCEDVYHNSTIHGQPQHNSNKTDNISQDLSSKDSNKEQNEVNVIRHVTCVAENTERKIDLTEEILEINDSNINKTYSKNINGNTQLAEQELAPETSIISEDLGTKKVLIAGRHEKILFDMGTNKDNVSGINNSVTLKNNYVNKNKDSGINNFETLFIRKHKDNETFKCKEINKDNVSIINNSDLIAVNSNNTKVIIKNQDETVGKKVSDVKSIPQSYKDSIIIEDLPNVAAGSNSQTKCVRIKLPSGRVFKATVHGKMNVNFDTLLSDPAVKDVLLSNLSDKKRYTLNVKQVATTTKNEKDKILATRVQEVKLHEALSCSGKIETINLLSDDEDDEPCQYFKTEQGKYKISLNKDDFTKHQKRFDQKCIVKLKRDNLLQKANTHKSNFKQINEVPKSTPSDIYANVSNQNLLTPVELPSVITILSSVNQTSPPSITEHEKLQNKKITINEPSVIEIDDSSNDSLDFNCSNTKKSNSTGDKITELKDLLLKDLGIGELDEEVTSVEKEVTTTEMLTLNSNTISNEQHIDENVIPIEKEITPVVILAHDSNKISPDIVDLTEEPKSDSMNDPFETNMCMGQIIPEDSPTASSLPELQLPNCYIKLAKCDNLVNKYKLINTNCYVKLIRCDQNCDIDFLKEAEITEDKDVEEIFVSDSPIKEPLSRSGSFSILNCFAEFDIDLLDSKNLERSNSPVIEVFEAIAAINNSFTKGNQFRDIGGNYTCKSDWCTTKCELQFQYKQRINKGHIIDDTKADHDKLSCLKSADIFNAPSLLTILLKFFQDNDHVTDQMRPINSVLKIQSPILKRKSDFDTGVRNKICKSNKSEKLLKETCLNEISDNLMAFNKSDNVHNLCEEYFSKQSTMTSLHIESSETKNVLETDQNNTRMEFNKISDNLIAIETESKENIDKTAIITDSLNDFEKNGLPKVQHDDKDIVIGKNEINNCCSEDNRHILVQNTALHQISEEIIQEINDIPNNLSDIINKSDDYCGNCEVQNEISTTEEDILAVSNNDITSTTKVYENILDCIEVSVADTSSNDNEIVNYSSTDESASDQYNVQINQPTEVITAMDINQDSLKLSDVEIEIPTVKKDVELLNKEESPLALNVGKTKFERTEMSMDITVGDNDITSTTKNDENTHDRIEVSVDVTSTNDNEIANYTAADENGSDQNYAQMNQPTEVVTAIDINQDNFKLSEVQIEPRKGIKDVELLNKEGPFATSINKIKFECTDMSMDITVGDNDITSTTKNGESTHDCTEVSVAVTSTNDNEIANYTAAGETGSDQSYVQMNQPAEIISAIDINQDNFKLSEVQIKTVKGIKDVELLNKESIMTASVDKTKFERTEMSIDIIVCDNDTTTTKIDENTDDCTEVSVAETLSNDNEIASYIATDETGSDQNNVQIDQPTEVLTAIDINQDIFLSKVPIETPTAIKDVDLLNKELVSASLSKNKFERTEMFSDITSSDNNEIDKYNNQQFSIEINNTITDTTIIDDNKANIETPRTKEDILLFNKNESFSAPNIDKITVECSELPIDKTLYDKNEMGNNEFNSDESSKQFEHPIEDNIAQDINMENVIRTALHVKIPTKEDVVLLDEKESSSATELQKTIIGHTYAAVALATFNNNDIVDCTAASEQNSTQSEHPIAVTTKIIEITSSRVDDYSTENVDSGIHNITNNSNVENDQAFQIHKMPFVKIAQNWIEINDSSVNGDNHNELTGEKNPDDRTLNISEEISNFIEIPNIPDHEYTASLDKINLLLESAEENSDENSGDITNINLFEGTLDIGEDYEITSDGSENVLIDVHTDEIYCDQDLFWSDIELRSEVVNSEVHEKELIIKSINQVESRNENYQINSNEIADIQDESTDHDHKSNEEKFKQVSLSPDLNPGILLKGIEFEDPEIGTCYVFPLVTSISESSECNSDANNIEEVDYIIDGDSNDEELKLNIPKITYSKQHTKPDTSFNALYEKKRRRSLKRKSDTTDIKIHEKKYRKGKGIDYPKVTIAVMSETTYTRQFKCLFDYFSSIKFSYSLPFHKDFVNVQKELCDWPIQNTSTVSNDEDEVDEYLFRDVETAANPIFPNPKEQTTLAEEIVAEYKETDYSSSDSKETNFNMGFGEGSDRVIQNLEGGDDISKFSAATLSDVKQSQPLLLSKSSKNNANTTKDEIEKLRRHHTYMQLRDRVRSFFRKTKVELSYDWVKENKKNCDTCDTSTFPFGLTVPDFIESCPVEAIVQVVQVGQLPVSAAAQNPVTCDPRVTHVSDVSPSQCSAENSPNSDSQSDIKTEYTELTTADFNLPLMQDYAHHNQALPMGSQEASNMPDENILIETEIKSVVKIELMEELPEDNQEHDENGENNYENNEPQNNIDNIDYSYSNVDTNARTTSDDTTHIDVIFDDTEKQHISDAFPQQKQHNGTSEKTDQIAHAMNAAGITTTTEIVTNNSAHALVNILSQKFSQDAAGTVPSATNNYPKSTSVSAMALQQALAQILPPPLNQTNGNENNQQTQNTSVTPQVLHIVQSKNGSGNQITLVDNTQQSVINTPNSTPVLHIVQNKGNPTGPTTNGAPTTQTTFSGLSLVDAGLQQGGNQLLHIVNTGNQKNNNAGQLLKRVNLLTNLANVQGSNEQKMVQFVCKSADGKAIQLNAPHQRSMVLRLQPIEAPNIHAAPSKPAESQDISPTPNAANTVPNKETLTPQEIKSRSIYEENYAKFIQNSSNKMTIIEKATILPKFNQAFGKQVYQDGNQKQNEIINSNSLLSSVNNNNDASECQSTENAINLEHITQISSPPLLLRKSSAQTSQAQTNLVQQIKKTIAPMNLQTMHGGVIYTRQIPVNIGGGQTINLITVPSTELIDDSTQKQQTDVKFVNQGEMEPSIIKIVPQSTPNSDGSSDENNTHVRASNDNSHTPQPQPVLTQMRIKLPMLSKTPQMVSGARVVRPSFFQIQRNVIGGTNQQVYQQLVLTAAPPLGQQTIRLPQTQANRQIKVPTDSQSSTESQMSSSTLEQLREFDLVLEQVKERSTVQPNAKSSNSTFSKLHSPSTDTTDGVASANSTAAEVTQQVLYSIGNNQPLNVTYVNRKATIAAPTKTTFVRSPDSSGIVDSSTPSHIQIPHTVTRSTSNSETSAQSKPMKPKPKPRPKASSNPPNTLKLNPVPPKPSTQKPLEDELTTQRILYILAEYKEQVENSPDKDKPAPRRRSNPPLNPTGSSKRKKSSSSSRRPGVRDISPIHGEDTCRTMGSEDSSCGTSQGDCNESCLDSHSPEDSPRKVVRKLTFEHEIHTTQPRPQPPRNVIVADGQTITVARGTAGKPATAVLMPANYILPVSMVKSGQQIAIVTNRGPKLLTVGGGEGGTTNALLLQRLIGPAGLKPVLARPGVRHVRLPTAALHNLQAFNLAAAATVQPPDSTASPVSAPTPPELVDTRANSSPWTDRGSDVKPERGSSPEGSEPWNLPSSADPHDYTYEETGRADNMDRTVLDSISDRYSPDMEAQRIFDKMFDVDSKKSYMIDSHIDSPRCGYDIDASDCDDKGYHQVVHKRDGSSYRQHRLTHVSAAALRHKYAILEHELRLQKSLSEECEDLGVDSPSASELFPEAELLFAASPAHDHMQDHGHHSHTPQPTFLNQSGIPQPDMDDQIATDQLLTRDHMRDDRADLNLGLEDVGIVTVSEDGMQATIALDQEEFARSHPNTTFHSEPTDDAEVHPFTISGLKGRHITSTIFHSNRPPGTVLMTAPQTTVISQANSETSNHHNVKYDIDNMINSLPTSHANTINLSSVLVKDDGLTRFDNLLNDNRELHLSNTASAIVHSAGNATQVIRRVCYDENKRDTRFLMDEPESLIAGDDAKMTAEDSSREATLESMADVDDDRSSPERHTELFWESNSASERSESRRPLDFSSDSDKCCKSPFDETNSTDSSGIGAHMRLDTVIKEARGIERSDGSSADDMHRPLRTYPPKRLYHSLEKDIARSMSGKTRAGERSPDALETRRRASARGVVKRGCHCCSGEPAPPRPKKPRQRKPTLDFTAHH